MKPDETRVSLSKLLWFRDEIAAGRCDEALERDYAELSARVEVALANMKIATSNAEAEVIWERAAEEIATFIAQRVRPTLH